MAARLVVVHIIFSCTLCCFFSSHYQLVKFSHHLLSSCCVHGRKKKIKFIEGGLTKWQDYIDKQIHRFGLILIPQNGGFPSWSAKENSVGSYCKNRNIKLKLVTLIILKYSILLSLKWRFKYVYVNYLLNNANLIYFLSWVEMNTKCPSVVNKLDVLCY